MSTVDLAQATQDTRSSSLTHPQKTAPTDDAVEEADALTSNPWTRSGGTIRQLPSAAGNLRSLWTAEIITLVLGLIQGLVIARSLGPTRFGTYAVITTFTAFVFLFLDPRSGDAVIRFLTQAQVEDDADRGRAVIRTGLLLDIAWGIAGLAVIALVGSAARQLFDLNTGIKTLLVAAAGLAAAAPIATSRAVLTTFERFKLVAYTQALVSLTRTVLVALVAFSTRDVFAILLALTLSFCGEATMFAVAAVRHAHRELKGTILTASLAPLRGHVGGMVRFLVFADLTSLVSGVIKQLDVLVVAAFTDPRQAGFFRLAKSFTAPAANIAGPVQTILYPKLARAVSSGDVDETERLIARTLRRLGLPLAAVSICALPLVEPMIVLLAGPEYRAAAPIAAVLLLGVAVSFGTLYLRPLYLALSEMQPLLWLSAASASLSLGAFLITAPIWGALGVAWSRTLTVTIGVVGLSLWIHRRLRQWRKHQDEQIPVDPEPLGPPLSRPL